MCVFISGWIFTLRHVRPDGLQSKQFELREKKQYDSNVNVDI